MEIHYDPVELEYGDKVSIKPQITFLTSESGKRKQAAWRADGLPKGLFLKEKTGEITGVMEAEPSRHPYVIHYTDETGEHIDAKLFLRAKRPPLDAQEFNSGLATLATQVNQGLEKLGKAIQADKTVKLTKVASAIKPVQITTPDPNQDKGSAKRNPNKGKFF